MFSILLGLLALPLLTTSEVWHEAPSLQPSIIKKQNTSFRLKSLPRKIAQKENLFFAARNYKTFAEKKKLKNIKSTVTATLAKLPKNHTAHLEAFEIRNENHASRGMANSHKIILHPPKIKASSELESIVIHEMGHVVDLGHLKGSSGKPTAFNNGQKDTFTDDASLLFYRLSWINSETRKTNQTRNDFVSGYAMHSSFEDFAESYTFYRLHGEKFRAIAQKSKMLQAKYNFFRNEVFQGKQFQTNLAETNFLHNIIWDTTLVAQN